MITVGTTTQGITASEVEGAHAMGQTQVSTVHLLADSHFSSALRSTGFVNLSQSTNAGLAHSNHSTAGG